MTTETEKMQQEIEQLKQDMFLVKSLLCQDGQQKAEKVKPAPVGESLDQKIAHALYGHKIKPNLKGYGYLKEALRIMVGETKNISITGELYPAIAEKFDTRPSRVERSIRHAIETAWREKKGRHDKPTNSEFIASVSEDLRLETWEGTEQ